jgi:hypothetical protein
MVSAAKKKKEQNAFFFAKTSELTVAREILRTVRKTEIYSVEKLQKYLTLGNRTVELATRFKGLTDN